jgi:hypothetical protein
MSWKPEIDPIVIHRESQEKVLSIEYIHLKLV